MLQPSWMDCVPDMSPVVVVELQVYRVQYGENWAHPQPLTCRSTYIAGDNSCS